MENSKKMLASLDSAAYGLLLFSHYAKPVFSTPGLAFFNFAWPAPNKEARMQ